MSTDSAQSSSSSDDDDDLLLLTSGPTFGSVGEASKIRTNRAKKKREEKMMGYLDECLDMETERDERKDRLSRKIPGAGAAATGKKVVQ